LLATQGAKCPVCCGDTRGRFVKGEYKILECTSCGHRFAAWTAPAGHADAVYGNEYFFGGGPGYPDYLGYAETIKQYGQRYARILSDYTRPGAVLDVGAAAGFISDGLRSAGWETECIEPNAAMVEHAHNALGLRASVGTLETFHSSQVYDLIVMIQVIAHFTDLRGALRQAARMTRPGGLWLIETWNNRSLAARFFGSHWHAYNPPSVLQYFNPHSLRLLARSFGMYPVASGHPRKQIQLSHALSLLSFHLGNRHLGSHEARRRRFFPGRISVPYPSDDVFWILFRKEKS
jgi:SAM-dependent methyltransferase